MTMLELIAARPCTWVLVLGRVVDTERCH